jgi:hypothetical protein
MGGEITIVESPIFLESPAGLGDFFTVMTCFQQPVLEFPNG